MRDPRPERIVIALFCRFRSLDRSDRRLVLEAASLMAFVWIGLRLIRFPTLRRMLDRYAGSPAPGSVCRSHPSAVGPVRWAITATAARLPVAATCLVQALAADAMLRRKGLEPALFIGVRIRDGAVPFEAHAWVECEGGVAIGGVEDLPDFTVLTVLTSP
jgi:hypothetical protein